MLNKLTTKSQEALIVAQNIALENGQQQISAVHLLYALLIQPESLVKTVMDKLQANTDTIKRDIITDIEKLPKTPIESATGTVQGTPEVAHVLNAAKQEADKMSDEFISTEHIFLALLVIKSSASQALAGANITYEEVLKILSGVRGNQRIN